MFDLARVSLFERSPGDARKPNQPLPAKEIVFVQLQGAYVA